MSADAPVRDRVAAVTNAVLKLVSDAAAVDLAERITVEAQLWSRPEVTVVVAGEPQSGKSALVNSLLARAILPTGSAAGTGRYVVLRHGSDNARVHFAESIEPRIVPLSEIGSWLGPTADGVHTVQGADLQVGAQELESGLVLVDTPGVGSVDDAGGRITLAALSTADALIYVVDAGRPISGTSLQFLCAAADRIDTVLIVLTKTDRFRGWRQVAADDRHAIVSGVPALAGAPIVPVSNRLKAMSDELRAGHEPDDQLRDESGFPRLADELRSRVVDRKQSVRLANLLRVAGRALDELDDRLSVPIQAETMPSAVQAAVERDQAELEELKVRAEQAQIVLGDGFSALRDAVTAEVNLGLRDLSARLEETVRARGGPLLGEAADLELRAIDAELAGSINAEAERLAAQASELLAISLDVGERGPLELSRPSSAAGSSGNEDLAARLRVSVAGAVASSGTGMALFASRVVAPSGPDVLLALFGGVAAIGVVVAGMNLRMVKRQADLQTTRKEIQAVIVTLRTSSGPAIRQRVLLVQRELEASMKAEVRARMRMLQQSVADGTRLARADAGERQKAAATARARREDISRVRGAVEALVREVSGP